MSEALSPAGAGPAALSLDGTGWEINEYDGFNRLTKSNRDGHVVSYGYRPDGLRLSKAEAGGITTHVWDGSNIVAEANGFTVTGTYLRGANLICAQAAGAREYFGFNAHGDVVQLTDASGNVTKAYRYDAFGNEHDPGANDGNPWRYCGEYFDLSSGAYYLRARYYDPLIGRMLSEDSYRGDLKDPLSLNLYTYCHNNPILFIDPSGHYNREAAAQYAVDYAYNYNQNYLNMGGFLDNAMYYYSYYTFLGMADCTNFTSQALIAGDLAMNSSWHYYEYKNKLSIGWTILSALAGNGPQYKTRSGDITYSRIEYDFTAAWASASKQYEYFSNPANGYINGDVIVISNVNQIANAAKNMGIQPGDLMYFVGENGVHHSTMITRITNTEIYYAGHTNNWDYRELSLGLGSERVFIVRIKDDA